MLIYCDILEIVPPSAPADVLACTAQWLTRKVRKTVTADMLLQGREISTPSGRVQSWAAWGDWPRQAAIQLSHRDSQVNGRQWVTQIGVQHAAPDGDTLCSVLVETNEISPLVTTPPLVTRPFVISNIADVCTLSARTPGRKVRHVNTRELEGVFHEIHDSMRRHSLVLLASSTAGAYAVDPGQLLPVALGLAEVLVIAPNVPLPVAVQTLGAPYCPPRGGITLIYPPGGRSNRAGPAFQRFPTDVDATATQLTQAILNQLAHRGNLPNSWRHISPEMVRGTQLRRQLRVRQDQLLSADELREHITIMETLLAEESTRNSALAQEIEQITTEFSAADDTASRLRYELTTLQGRFDALEGQRATKSVEGMSPEVRTSLLAVLDGKPTVIDALRVAVAMFPDSCQVLPSAWKSAEKAKQFERASEVFELLRKLFKDYRDILVDGGSDGAAKAVFGRGSYASGESDTVMTSKAGRHRRTFVYSGEEREMMTHLKIGVKESDARTFRAHFLWDADTQRIILGHCGRHLDQS